MAKISYVTLAEKLIESGVRASALKIEILEADLAAATDADEAARIMKVLEQAKA